MKKMSSGLPLMSYNRSASALWLTKIPEATYKLVANRSCSCSRGLLLRTIWLNKRLQTDRTVVGHQRDNQRTFSLLNMTWFK